MMFFGEFIGDALSCKIKANINLDLNLFTTCIQKNTLPNNFISSKVVVSFELLVEK